MVSEALRQAISLHQQGKLDQAASLYRAVLQERPEQFEALYLSGLIAAQKGNFSIALENLSKAITSKPDFADAHNNYGNVLLELNRPADALGAYDKAVAIKPALYEAHNNRGSALMNLGRTAEALQAFDRALAINPDFHGAHNNRGNALRKLNRPAEALDAYDRALAIRSEYFEAHHSRGITLLELNRPAEALEAFDHALTIRPDYPEAHSSRGNALFDLGRTTEALAAYDHALATKPDSSEAHNNRANALGKLNRPADALEACDRALAINPDYFEAHNNRGNALVKLGRSIEALEAYNRTLTINPDHPEAHYNRSHCRLLMGNFDDGWAEYEWRWDVPPLKGTQRSFSQPLWLGQEDLTGKTILLHSEQGLGDTLQFCRYAPLVAARGAQVILGVQPSLKTLLSNLAGSTAVISPGDVTPPFDYHTPLLSLPLAFKTRLDTIPANTPYLFAEPTRVAAWRNTLGRTTTDHRLRIGVVWSGNPNQGDDRTRSIPFARFSDLIGEYARFVCLQKEVRETDAELFGRRDDIFDARAQLLDFADTAALIELMDIVVTVDTSIAHLAGAMGKRTFLLLPYAPDWRWLLEREDSPWYPSMRLFRQTTPGDWTSVIARVREELESTAAQSSA